MSLKSAQRFLGSFMIEDLFSLEIKQNRKNTIIAMQLHTPVVNTVDIPQTYELLEKFLPKIFHSECFNDANLPFAYEVRQTEIGHLFEHILLEYLCQIKLTTGCRNATYNGRTFWNWVKNPMGSFAIVIDAGPNDARILPIALNETIQLVSMIMRSQQDSLFSSVPVNAHAGTEGFGVGITTH
jgi:hypothetical protein